MLAQRLFGPTGLRVAEIGLGTMSFGTRWRFGADEATSHRILGAYEAAGGNFLDTADVYHQGETEAFVGRWLAGRRERMVVASKYSMALDPSDPNGGGNHRKHLMHAVEASLQRLHTDHLDLLWVHAYDGHTPIQETLRALDDLVRMGKVRYLGISDAPSWVVSASQVMAELRGWSAFAGLQIEYSLLQRTPERELLPMADHFGLSVVPWGPLGGGVLTGKYTRDDVANDTLRAKANGLQGRTTDDALAIARALDAVADELGCTSAQAALAWVRSRGYGMLPIVGARTVEQLEDSLAAAAVALPDDAVARLDAVSEVPLGFPHELLAGAHLRKLMHGERGFEAPPGRRFTLPGA